MTCEFSGELAVPTGAYFPMTAWNCLVAALDVSNNGNMPSTTPAPSSAGSGGEVGNTLEAAGIASARLARGELNQHPKLLARYR